MNNFLGGWGALLQRPNILRGGVGVINVSSNIDEIQKKMARVSKKLRYAENEAINQSAKHAAKVQHDRAKSTFDRPTPYLLGGIYNPKTKLGFVGVFSTFQTLRAELIPGGPRGSFREGGKRINDTLRLQSMGGTRTPDKRALVVPVSPQAKNKYGNLPRGKIKKLLATPGVVSLGRQNGGLPPGIYRRLKGGRLKMLVAYEPQARYQRMFDYHGIGRRAFSQVIDDRTRKAVEDEMKNL